MTCPLAAVKTFGFGLVLPPLLELLFEDGEALPDPPDHVQEHVTKEPLGAGRIRPFVGLGAKSALFRSWKVEADRRMAAFVQQGRRPWLLGRPDARDGDPTIGGEAVPGLGSQPPIPLVAAPLGHQVVG